MLNKRLALCLSVAAFAAIAPIQAGLVDVTLFNNIVYTQTSSDAPTTPSSYYFTLGGDFLNTGDFSDVNVTYTAPAPGSTPVQFLDLPITAASFSASSPFFTSAGDLQNALPFGTYIYTATMTPALTQR